MSVSNDDRGLSAGKRIKCLIFCFSFKVCCICSFLDNEPLTYSGGYMFPDWAYHLGRAIALSSMVTVPIWTAVKLFMGEGTLRQARAHRDCLPRHCVLSCGWKCCCTPQFVYLIIFSLCPLSSASGGPLVSCSRAQKKTSSRKQIRNGSTVNLSFRY